MPSTEGQHSLTQLRQEHQSKALLIKLGWIAIAGGCLVFIATLQWEGRSASAYVMAKVGVNLWLIACLGVIVTIYSWLRSIDGMTQIASRIEMVAAGLVLLLWAPRAMYYWFAAGSDSASMPWIDPLGAFFTLLGLVAARSARSSKTNPALVVATFDCVLWFLAGFFLLGAVTCWLINGGLAALGSAIATALLALIALLVAVLCAKVRKKLGVHAEALDSGDLDYVAAKINIVAWFIVVSCGAILLVVLFQGKTVSATASTAFIGGVAAVMAIKITIRPKFEDKLRVFSSSMGTQFVYPVEILLTEEAYGHMRKVRLSEEGPSPKKTKRS